MTAPQSALAITQHRDQLEFVAEALSRRAENHDKDRSSSEIEEQRIRLRNAVIALLDSWEHLAENKGKLQYQQEEGEAPPLLYDPLDPELRKQSNLARKFKAQRSLRDVEQTVNLWIINPDGQERGEEQS